MNATDDNRRIWTAWLHYAATGEGTSVLAYMSYAASEDELRQRVASKFGQWYADGCEVQEGIARNEVTQYLWSEDALRTFERIGIQRGQLEVYSKVHINSS